MRLQRGERVSRDFRARGGDARNQRGFSRVGKADQANVRQKLEFEAQVALFAGAAIFVFARCLVPGSGKGRMAIAATAAAATRSQKALAGSGEVENLLARCIVKDDGSDG